MIIQSAPKLITVDEFIAQAVLGVPEYWIVDYLGVGGREYIGKPKQPTITICNLVEDEYRKELFRTGDMLVSSIFSDLRLTATQILAAGQ